MELATLLGVFLVVALGSGRSDVIQYITIASVGNALDFGNLLSVANGTNACSDATRGVWGAGSPSGGGTRQNVIQYITVATTGNSLDFGDLSSERYLGGSLADESRGIWCGGITTGGSGTDDVIDYVTIQTTGNASDFGNLVVGKREMACLSGD